LEVIRDQDVPGEVLEEEDPTVTMPRRLGLSDVVERQIRSFKDDVRRRVRLSDAEVTDLFRLVIRRPDSEEIFYKVGRMLAAERPRRSWQRIMPRSVVLAMARGRTRRGLKRLFGRPIGGFGRGSFVIEGRALLFIQADPGGDACAFMTGFCEAVLEEVAGSRAHVTHTFCQARRHDQCRWEGTLEAPLVDARRPKESVETSDPRSDALLGGGPAE
jgi:hypothetical protein